MEFSPGLSAKRSRLFEEYVNAVGKGGEVDIMESVRSK